MAYYTDEQLAQAGQALAQGIKGLTDKVTELEQRPALESMQQQWTAGQQSLRHAGWGAGDIARLEQFMEQKGIADHGVARQVYPYAPSTRGWLLNRLEADERQALENRDDDTFLSLAIGRALSEERGGW